MRSSRTARWPAFLGAHALLFALPITAGAQVRSFGPLTFEEGSPLQRISYTHTTEAADPVPRGTLETSVWMGYSNIFERDSTASHDLFLDLERLISTAGVRYGVTDDFEVGGRLSWETSGGGVLDTFISEWHETFGLANADRGRYPSDAYAQRLRDRTGALRLDVPPRTMGLDDVRLFAKWRALHGRRGRRVLALRGVARFPTQENQAGPERADVSMMALGRLSWSRWHVHGTVGGATVRVAHDYGGLLRSSSWFADLGVERNLTSSFSAIAQYSLANARLRGIGDPELDGFVGNFVFGAAGSFEQAWRWEVSFQEDIPPQSPSVDFTLGIGIRRRW
jgi:hypothetical protein